VTPAGSGKRDFWGLFRVWLVAACLCVLFGLIGFRAAGLALAGAPEGASSSGSSDAVTRRADIVDSHGGLLATSVSGWSLAADPRAIWDARDVASALATVLPGVDVPVLAARLAEKNRRFIWVRRGITPQQKQAVFELGLEGLQFHQEMRRVYPGGRLAGHLLGFVDVDGHGVEGVERVFDDRLSAGGDPLRLTIDSAAQFALEAELDAAADAYRIRGAAGLIIDADSGAVRAIASWPAFNPSAPASVPEDARLNRALGAVYELGSVFKPLTVAGALERGAVSGRDRFDVRSAMRFSGATIRDPHPMTAASASIEDILAYSSNVGAARIGQRLGAEGMQDFLASLGLLGRLRYDGPPAASPLTPREWSDLTVATVSYGHGLAVTPLSFAMAFLPFANGGDFVEPLFVEEAGAPPPARRRVMSPETALRLTDMMRQVVVRGTGANADAPGYEVAGKTGTAEKIGAGGYDTERNVTSFVAIFPASSPRFVALIVLDEAQSDGVRTAAYNAATVAGRIVARAAPALGVTPTFPAPGESEGAGLASEGDRGTL
jgi:cell division protein FtsI (penicillin-binding protein 3)